MSTLILSDVHCNLAALVAVLNHAYGLHPDIRETWCLGDTVGYGPDLIRVWQKLKTEPIPAGGWLAGNHEWGLLGRLDGENILTVANGRPEEEDSSAYSMGQIRGAAWQVLQAQRMHLEGRIGDGEPIPVEERLVEYAMLTHLSALPAMSSPRPGIYLTHGAFYSEPGAAVRRKTTLPDAPSELVRSFNLGLEHSPAQVCEIEPQGAQRPRLFACGHTHLQGLWRWRPDRAEWAKEGNGGNHPLGDLETQPIFINPGSVGFARNRVARANFAIIDWEGQVLRFYRAPYDVESTRQKMEMSKVHRPLLSTPGFLPAAGAVEEEANDETENL